MKKMFRTFVGYTAFSLSLCAAAIASADDADQLLSELSGIESLQGAFIQQQYHQGSSDPVESRGHFKLRRPGYFSWEIESPDSQLIIATPDFVWQHDRDLETVTRRPVDDSAQMSPLQVLGGDADELRARYQVGAEGQGRYRLTPLQQDSAFQSLQVSFAQHQIVGMEIRDNLGQRVVVEFSHLDRSPLGPDDFSFTPPPGADLFYYDQ